MSREWQANSRCRMGSPVGKIRSSRDMPNTWHAADTLFILVIIVLCWNYLLTAWGFNSSTWIRVPASILTIGVFLRKCQCLKPAFLYWNSDNHTIMSFYEFRGTTHALCTELSKYRTSLLLLQFGSVSNANPSTSIRGPGTGAQVNCSLLSCLPHGEQPSTRKESNAHRTLKPVETCPIH